MNASVDEPTAELTPVRIQEALQRLLAARPAMAMKRRSVTAFELLEALWGPALPGPEVWRARQALKAQLVAMLATMPGLTYVEGDA